MGAEQESGQNSLTDEIHSPVSIGVAISGGGVRAAFFALGSLLYLVDSGLNQSVRLISSVSGGSIVNAAIALSGDFSEAKPNQFHELAGRICDRMAGHGVFFWPGWFRGLLGFVPSLGLLAYLFFTSPLAKLKWWEVVGFFIGALIVFALYRWVDRGRIQQLAYSNFLMKTAHSTDRHRLQQDNDLSKLPASKVAHVLCATELTSGQPFYMSREMVLSPVYGRGNPSVAPAEAVYASAAFPLGFPPLRLSVTKLDLAGGLDDDPPRHLLLSDGGVFNNLGTETFSADSSVQVFLPDPSLPIIPSVDFQVVINASAPAKRAELSSIRIWRSIVYARRIMSVMYENTLRPRMQRLMEEEAGPRGPIVVDISESPIELLDRLSSGRPDDDPVRCRAQRMRDRLRQGRRTDHDWKIYADKAAQTKTVLSAVGQTVAVRLVLLGYLDTAIACRAHLDTAGIDSVPDERWFKNLVNNKPADRLRGSVSEEAPSSPADPGTPTGSNEAS